MALSRFQQQSMSFQPPTNQCVDPSEMENWVDFNGLTSPNTSSSKMPMSHSASVMPSPTNTMLPLDGSDDHQTPVAPSHDYSRFKQQTGLPTNSMASLRALNEPQTVFASYNSGIDEYGLGSSMYDQAGLGSMTGDTGFDSELPAFFFPGESSQHDDFIDPTAIQKQEEAQANVRYYPGMHQQAALRAQQQAQQQRQHQQMLQKQREAEQQRARGSRRGSHLPVDAHTEETIARVVNQIRHNSNMSGSMSPDPQGLSHISRSRKEEDEMDEDERLLNSEEGKKLSSKERRQLRNKVSARAFRSRRKEYIGQLEGEIQGKVNECNDLKLQNRALMEENARFRMLAEKLLAHAAFRPFLDELSHDPELAMSLAQVSSSNHATPTPASQQQTEDTDAYNVQTQQYMNSQHVGMTMIPETQLDFSALNLGGNNWAVPNNMGMNNFQQPQIYAVLEVPEEPVNVAALAGKYEDTDVGDCSYKSCKHECPAEIVEEPVAAMDVPENGVSEPITHDFDESDPAYTLFAASSSPSKSAATAELSIEELAAEIPTEKPSNFELFSSDCAASTQLEKKCAKLDAAMSRLSALVSSFGL